MSRSFADFLDSMMIAMEADDITQQAQAEVKTAIGGRNLTTDDNGPEEDLGKTTDIFNQNQTQDDDPNGNPEQDNLDGQNADAPDTGENQAQGDQPEEDQEESQSDDPNLQESPQDEQPQTQVDNSNDPIFTKKNTVRDNLAQLYTIVCGNIDMLTTSLGNLNDLPSIKVANAVLGHLRNCKNYIYKTLTVNIAEMEYEELLKRYITLKRVYDVCLKMLEIHFKDEQRLKDKKKN